MTKREASPQQLEELAAARRACEQAEAEFTQTLHRASIVFLGLANKDDIPNLTDNTADQPKPQKPTDQQ